MGHLGEVALKQLFLGHENRYATEIYLDTIGDAEREMSAEEEDQKPIRIALYQISSLLYLRYP